MSAALLVLLPALAAPLFLLRALRARATPLLVAVALLVAALALRVASAPGASAPGDYVLLDATTRLFLGVLAPIFLGISVYVWNRVQTAPELGAEGARFACLACLFLALAHAVLLSNHLLLQWLALEASTLVAAPLIVRPGVPASRRASWRYLLFSTVGLGLALAGFLCLERGLAASGAETGLFVDRLLASAPAPANTWTRLGLALLLLGLGTKLGLAPMYSWLPEAYDESPPAVAALLGALQFNCALVVLFRVVQVFRGANEELFSAVLLTLGILSMVVSTANIVATHNMKRLIAYAAIHHAGVIALGLGVGPAAAYGLLLYVLCNAYIKAILFLTAGKIKAHYRTKDTREISGLMRDLPYSGVFLLVGTFALLGLPPFGSFLGELLILSALVGADQMLLFATACVLLTMTFVATGRTVFPMIWGEPRERRDWPRQTLASAWPKLVFLVALVVLGVYVPPPIQALIQQVASSLEGR